MNLVFTLSLEQRALVNIAITLWSQDDVRDLMSKSAPLHILCNNWQEIEKSVIQKSFKLQIPETLKKELLCFIVRVGFQLLSWIDLHHHNYGYVTQLPAAFVWTSLGTINNKETAKLLVMGGTLDGGTSFALACMYCLEDEIKYCWNTFNNLSHRSMFKYRFVLYWFNYVCELYRIEAPLPYSLSFFIPSNAFLIESARSGNEVTLRYFFEVIGNFESLPAALNVVRLELEKLENFMALPRNSEIMLFLLSKINAEKQANFIRNCTYAVLKCFLLWPFHNQFLKIANDNWNSLSKDEYKNLLYYMVVLMRYEHNLHELFEAFWQHSPKDYKQFIGDQGNIVDLLISLYKIGGEKNVKLILKDLSISSKKNIFKIESKEIFIYLVSFGKWDSIKFLIQECLSSQEDLIRFRDVLKNHVHELLSGNGIWKNYSEFEFMECQWDKFFYLVDGCIFGYNTKKRHTEYNNTSSKNHWCKGIKE